MTNINDVQRYLGEETIDHHREGLISRRDMFRQLVAICGSASAAGALLAACSANSEPSSSSSSSSSTPSSSSSSSSSLSAVSSTSPQSSAATVAPTTAAKPILKLRVAADDPAIAGADVTFPGAVGPLLGYLARPSVAGAAKSRAGIIVIHEIFGLTDHIRDVTRRLAKAGFVALSVDLASRAGGTAKGGVSGALGQLAPGDALVDLRSAATYLATQPDYSGKLGVTGFCYGGGMTLRAAANVTNVTAAVAYYGTTPEPADQMGNATGALLVHYAANDARVNGTMQALKDNVRTKFETRIHEGAGHGFNNDTGANYFEPAAIQAWGETLSWFGFHLGQ